MRKLLVTFSIVGHATAVFALDQLPERAPSELPTVIEMVTGPEPEELEPPPPVERPAEPEPLPEAQPEAPARPQAEPEVSEVEPPPSALEALPDLGLSLSGTGTSGGLAIAARTASPAPVASRRVLSEAGRSAAQSNAANKAPCTEGAAKPKLVQFAKPAYTDAARAGGVTGKVRVSITVGPKGTVEAVTLLQGLGHGLDEATLAAVQRATFEPASPCGSPTTSTFTMSVRFEAD